MIRKLNLHLLPLMIGKAIKIDMNKFGSVDLHFLSTSQILNLCKASFRSSFWDIKDLNSVELSIF